MSSTHMAQASHVVLPEICLMAVVIDSRIVCNVQCRDVTVDVTPESLL